MKILSIITISLLLSNFAFADCPVANGDVDTIEAKIAKSKTCTNASKIAKECAYGSRIDALFTATAITKCEKDFQNLTTLERATYNGLQKKCVEKYEGQDGTMYVSAIGFCRLSVAETFSEVFSRFEY